MTQNIHFARRQVGVSDECGLHPRVAVNFVKLANSFQSEVWVHCKGITANGRSIPSLLSLAAECGTILALEAQGCDAEDAVVALADLISPETHESENQRGVAACWSPKSRPTQGPPGEGRSTESPVSQRRDSSWKCGPRWDSWRRRSTSGPGIERRTATRGRWLRRGS